MKGDVKVASSVGWSSIEIFFRFGLKFLITLILARILTPFDYGTIGLLSIFINIAAVLAESNLSVALIQRDRVSDVDTSSVFYFNLAMSTIVAILLCLFSPRIADFYEMPVLEPLLMVLSVSIVVNSFSSIQRTLLVKELNFRRQTVVTFIATMISGLVAVFLAYAGFGVWSLVAQVLVASLVSAMLYWAFCPWRPKLIFSLDSLRVLLGFSGYLVLSDLLESVANRLNTLVIGKFYSPVDLGFYSRSSELQQLPCSLLSKLVNRVAFPVFCRNCNDKTVLIDGMNRAISFVMLFVSPIMLGMAVCAPSLVVFLYGEQWLSCSKYLQILCIGGLFWPMQVFNMSVLKAQGYSDFAFRLEMVKKAVSVIFLFFACFFSVSAIAWSTVASSIVGFIVSAHYTGSLLSYGAVKQSFDVLPYLLMSCVMSFFVFIIPVSLFLGNSVNFIAQLSLGLIIYMALCYFFKLKAFVELLVLFKKVFIYRRNFT